MLQKRLKIGVIKPCHSFYQISKYFVKKNTLEKYRLIKIVIKFYYIAIQEVCLSLSVDAFGKEFAGNTILSLINFFSYYN